MGERTIITISFIIFNIVLIVFISGIIIFVKQYRAKKKAHMSEILNIDESHKKQLLETEMEIQSQTMKHIGREIHDNVGQKLTLASLYAQQLAFENKAPHINQNISNISDIINQSLSDLRELSKSLTSNTIDTDSLPTLIKRECDRINGLNIAKVSFTNKDEVKVDNYTIKSVLFRITQEFIQNSIKHAACKNIKVSLYKEQTNLFLKLEDDGIGFDVTNVKSNGIGLKNIEKRTELIGGVFKLESQQNQGTTLTIQILIAS
ncbi:histidine kinase [Aequorivita sublithincola DSM 14238]|uniref:histidine kinase n=2 Tax=Aequorivita TaxID=153265 RepID=I3YYE9_AEQSU|nr:histidine kinase [Aequorivita sublithincola DSM 14238]